MTTVFDQLGEEGFRALVSAFYLGIRADDLIGPIYPQDDWEGSEQRLRDFLVGRFGGPQRYIQQRGHPRLRMRHLPFAIGKAERDRWLQLMASAMEQSETPEPSRRVLTEFFTQTADFMRNKPG
jgi:hemoglobin